MDGGTTTWAPDMNFTNSSVNGTNHTSDSSCYLPSNPSTLITLKVYIFSSVIFVVIGLVGNALSFMIFSSKEMRVVSSNVYLLTLSLSDSLYLIFVLLNKIIKTLRCMYFKDTFADISNLSNFSCIFLQYMVDLFSDYSACLVVAFTVERYIACYRPITFKEACTVKRARITCLVILLIISISICPHHVMYMGLHDQFHVCSVLVQFESEFTISYIVEALLYRICPVFIIAVLNVFIITKVSKVHAERRKRRSTTRLQNSNKKNNQQDRHMQLTIMLILVSSTYIVLYLPVLVHFFLWKLVRSDIISMSQILLENLHNCASMLYVSGFAINFFLYTMSGKVFRDQLNIILCEANNKHKAQDASANVDEKQTLV